MIALYNTEQVYQIEKAWFAQGHDSFALMQQAAWQCVQRIIHAVQQKPQTKRACVWVGHGNNGGDGWLISHYLQKLGWQVTTVVMSADSLLDMDDMLDASDSDAHKAQRIARQHRDNFHVFQQEARDALAVHLAADVYVDALFGIGFDRAPTAQAAHTIGAFNHYAAQHQALKVAIDVPSGVVAQTGQVFDGVAIRADITLCLVARKQGLHTKDALDYIGRVTDIPLVPHSDSVPNAWLLSQAYPFAARQNNSHKGSYGHVLIVGGNRIDGSQGMGGAAILAASSAMAAGAGKITVACHDAFHGAVLTSLPDAMTLDVHDTQGVRGLIQSAQVVAIGMGLGRDATAEHLFQAYVQTAMEHQVALIIDADGLYHLATLDKKAPDFVQALKAYAQRHSVRFTPHSGEAARLLHTEVASIEQNRFAAIRKCAQHYGGDWLLKGAGSLVLEEDVLYVCAVGNAGLASAGMGDVLSGVNAGLMAQQDLDTDQRSLRQAVLLHGMAGDTLTQTDIPATWRIGQRGLQAQDMPAVIRHEMTTLSE
ncbi:NAD(P)H-hydrate dehydratase [Psychrobacter aestuarii]|uniref:ADP-dependent (S)-NAD(P)H-hydrate dehydratase n=1 Tax=Psychrobacter aestuarii TaxID=556327 RepID=A0ABN0VVP2_9GAMM|nr:NAD(P)H-hydrate dehydratase [Psychrobacter aestuarii]